MKSWDGSLNADDQARLEGAQTRLAGRRRDDLHSIRTEFHRVGRRDCGFGTEMPAIPSLGFALALAFHGGEQNEAGGLSLACNELGREERGRWARMTAGHLV